MKRAAYSASITDFLCASEDEILGALTRESRFDVVPKQRNAWLFQVDHLQQLLSQLPHTAEDSIYFEYLIPRMGRRIDVLLLLRGILFVLEYKVGEHLYPASAFDQVVDYALDLKHFHETSHQAVIVPILVATHADQTSYVIQESKADRVLAPIGTNDQHLLMPLQSVLEHYQSESLNTADWQQGRYEPTPTIIEAARALYGGHQVKEISRSDAGAMNLAATSDVLERIIADAQQQKQKVICFVTGVPGAGKTLVGLNIATKHFDQSSKLYSVFLSGNGPLVAVLHEALAQDHVDRAKAEGKKLTKGKARSRVKAFIQNVHHFRDEGLRDPKPPIEHIALFDEAQRAWDQQQTANFMKQKKGLPDFAQSEPGFLISCMDRHQDWAVIVCLVGGGQEINAGEAGIGGWLDAIQQQYPDWHIHAAPNLTDKEYQAADFLHQLEQRDRVHYHRSLHLAVSMRSFRAEHVSNWVKAVLDGKTTEAKRLYQSFVKDYPIVLTRSFDKAKSWIRQQARGNERYGLMVSSQASRLKPYAIDIRPQIDPVHWFLKDKTDIRSSYYLEDVATEFHVQGD